MPLTDEITDESANQDSDSYQHTLADAPILDAFNLNNNTDSSDQSQTYRLSFGSRLGYILVSFLIGVAATLPIVAILAAAQFNTIARAPTREEELTSDLLVYAIFAVFVVVVPLWYSRKTKYGIITATTSFFIAAAIPTAVVILNFITCDECRQYGYEYPFGTITLFWVTVTGTLTAVLSKAIDSMPKINIIWE